MSYAGLVIGGPWAGKSFEARTGKFELAIGAQYVRFPTGGGTEARDMPPERFEYVYTEMMGAQLWVPRGWSPEQIVKEIFGNYRPAAIRDVAVTVC